MEINHFYCLFTLQWDQGWTWNNEFLLIFNWERMDVGIVGKCELLQFNANNILIKIKFQPELVPQTSVSTRQLL